MKRTKVIARILTLVLAVVTLAGAMPEPAQAAGFAAIVTASSMMVYADSALSRIATTLPEGEIVTVNAYSGDVAAIAYAGSNGFAAVDDLARIADTCEKARVSVSAARVYETQSTAARSVLLKKGFTVYLVDVKDKWARIVVGSRVGYTNIDWLVVESAEPTPTATPQNNWIPAVVTARSVKVYITPSTSGRLMATLKKGAQVNVIDYTKKWAHVEKNGYYGYMPTSALAPTGTATPTPTPTPTPTAGWIEATVTAAALKVYASASTGSRVLGTLKKGARVNVVEYNSAWAHIEYNGYHGYCSVKGLAQGGQATPTPTATAPVPATVTVDAVRVYASASTSSKSLGTLKRGVEVKVVDANSTWAYIELNGRYGYCYRAALTPTSEVKPTYSVQFQATVVYPNMPVYMSPSANAASTTYDLGTTVDVYTYDDTWALIGRNEMRGYTLVKYLNHASLVELTSGDSGDSVLAMQKALEALGYFDAVPAGNYSTQTTDAVKRFQAAVGLSQTGSADLVTLRILNGGFAPASPILSAALTKGSSGANVTRLQTRLLAKGYLSKAGSVDGDFGSITTAAVKLFQKAVGLTQSGTADVQTMQALYANGAPANGGNPADASATPTVSPTIIPTDTPGNNARIETVVTAAKNQLGKPYVYGTMGMKSFDCSGLTSYAYKQIGVTLNRTAYGQGYNDGVKIEGLSNLVRGDIVCMNTISDSDLSDHVGIYLGGGQMVHASSGKGQVIISSLTSGYYNRVFSWGRRIIQ